MELVDGCIQIHGSTFVGRTRASFEVWTLDQETGVAGRRGEGIVSDELNVPPLTNTAWIVVLRLQTASKPAKFRA